MISNWIVQCVFQKNKTRGSVKVSKLWSQCYVICCRCCFNFTMKQLCCQLRACLVACAVGGVVSRQSKVRWAVQQDRQRHGRPCVWTWSQRYLPKDGVALCHTRTYLVSSDKIHPSYKSSFHSTAVLADISDQDVVTSYGFLSSHGLLASVLLCLSCVLAAITTELDDQSGCQK